MQTNSKLTSMETSICKYLHLSEKNILNLQFPAKNVRFFPRK